MKNLFITGALGQDGTILTNILKKNKNLNIYSIVENTKYVDQKKNIIKVNLLKVEEIENIFSKIKPHYVVHLGSRNPSYKEKNFKKFYEENMLTTKNIFNSTFKFNDKSKFLFCNSSQIFKKKEGIVNERSKYKIRSDYTRFRIECNEFMQNFKKKYNIKYTNIVMFNHDSIYRNPKFLIPRIIKSILKKNTNFLNKIIKENINGDFSHAEDICNGLVKILFNKKNENNIILGSGYLTSMTQIIDYVFKKRKIFLMIKKLEVGSKTGLIGNPSLAKKKFNWKPKKNIFDAGLEIYDFYKKNNLT